jgi:hypothetical protein
MAFSINKNKSIKGTQSRPLCTELQLYVQYQENNNIAFILNADYNNRRSAVLTYTKKINLELLQDKINSIRSTVKNLIETYEDDDFDNYGEEIKLLHKQLARDGNRLYNYLLEDSDGFNKNTKGVKLFDLLFDSINPKHPIKLQVISNDFKIPIELLNRTGEFNMSDFVGSNFIIPKTYTDVEVNLNRLKNHKLGHLLHIENNKSLQKYYETKLFNKIKKSLCSFQTVALNDKENLTIEEFREFLKKDDHIDFVHFEGHIRHNDEAQSKSYFDFDNLKIKYDEIDTLTELAYKVLFLNCCKSGNNNHNLSENFTKEFIKIDLATIISVDINVPKRFAREFAKVFYTKVFINNFNLDDALYQTRMYFYKKENNLTGWFYSVYGETNIDEQPCLKS